jgi:hypothetical protein
VKILPPAAESKNARIAQIGSLPGTWLRDKELVRSHHLSGQKDSGYEANSIAMAYHTIRGREVNLRLHPYCFGDNNALVGYGMGLRLWFHGQLRGDDATVDPKREEAIPARRAAIRGGAK